MTRDGTVGSIRRNRAKPGVSSGHRSRLNDEDSVRAPHQGQQSTRTAPTGRTHDCKRPLRGTLHFLLQGGGHPHMKRREFITLLGGAITSRPIPANAQEPVRVRTVGALMGFANDAAAKARVEAFEQGLESEGWSVGQNLRIEYRYAEGDSVRMQALAKELVELKPGCILGQSTPVTAGRAALAALRGPAPW